MKKLRVLVSGGTGFLGSFVLPLLKGFSEVTCISRTQPETLRADLSFWDGKMNPKELNGKFDIFLHMAGLYDLRIGELESQRNNVVGTHTALTIAQKAKIPHFIHISTIAVCMGDPSVMVSPDDLDCSKSFPDYYASSKAHAEQMVRSWEGGIKSKTILRLGILVGDTKTGRISRIDGPYHAPYKISQVKSIMDKIPGPLILPGNSDHHLPIVPADKCAEAICDIIKISRQEEWEGLKALHLTPRKGLSAEKLYSSTLNHLGMRKRKLRLLEKVPKEVSKIIAHAMIDFPKEELEYLLAAPQLDTSETEKLLGKDWCPDFCDYEQAFWKGYDDYVSNS